MADRTNLILAAILAVFLGGASVAQAAVLETEVTPEMAEMGCTARLSGEIVDGDLERIRPFLETPLTETWGDEDLIFRNFTPATDFGDGFFSHRLCLNSPGGSLEEALRIVAYFRENGSRTVGGIQTGIARGDLCESACAYVFFAGRFVRFSGNPGYEGRSNAILHPNGILGLHTPFLRFVDGSFSRDEVLAIWQVGMEAASRINRQIANGNIFMSPDLFSEMITYAPSEMLRMQTVNDVVRWEIEVEPSPVHSGRYDYTLGEFAGALCRNGASLTPDFVDLRERPGGLDLVLEPDNSIRSQGTFADRLSERRYSCVVGPEQWDYMSRAVADTPEDWVLRRTRGNGSCSFRVTYEPFEDGEGRPLEVELPCIAAFPPDLPLADLLP